MYADPKTGKGAFYDPEYGFWSRSDTEKVPTTQLLHYQNPEAKRDWMRKRTAEIKHIEVSGYGRNYNPLRAGKPTV